MQFLNQLLRRLSVRLTLTVPLWKFVTQKEDAKTVVLILVQPLDLVLQMLHVKSILQHQPEP